MSEMLQIYSQYIKEQKKGIRGKNNGSCNMSGQCCPVGNVGNNLMKENYWKKRHEILY